MISFSTFSFLVESIKDAMTIFTQQGATVPDASHYLLDFRLAKQLNLIPNKAETDIGYWIKKGWGDFRSFVDDINEAKRVKEVHRTAQRDTIPVFENEFALVLIPKTHEAMRKYAYDTKWCIAYNEDRYYREYIFGKGMTPNVVILKPKLANMPIVKESSFYKMCVMVMPNGEIDSVWTAADSEVPLDTKVEISGLGSDMRMALQGTNLRPEDTSITLRDIMAKFGLVEEIFISALRLSPQGNEDDYNPYEDDDEPDRDDQKYVWGTPPPNHFTAED